MASVEVNQMLAAAVAACEDKKAEDIRILALDPVESGLSDYFLICTGSNDRQTVAITDEIELRLKREFATYPNSVEGRRQGEWILMDYVDFIVHVFLPEKRAFYGLERLRKSATTLSVGELNTEIKSAIEAKRPAVRRSGPEQAGGKTAANTLAQTLAKTAAKTGAGKSVRGKTVVAKRPATKKAAAKKSVAKQASAKRPTKRAGAKRSAKPTASDE